MMANTLSENLTRWAAQRDQRVKLGDALGEPREIDHTAIFRNRSGASDAAALLEASGFRVALARSGFRTTLSASRNDSLTDESVAAFLGIVIPIVEQNGGKYDGFGGGVVR